jgi:putative endonuclease
MKLTQPKGDVQQPEGPSKTAAKMIGDDAELLAKQFLESQGCIIIETNFQTKVGEIDIITWDGSVLAFVEVRRRINAHFGGAAASVTLAKQQKIRRTAQWYLKASKLDRTPVCRFDVISMTGLKLDWIKAAF